MVTSGIRVGTPAVTTRGFNEPECRTLAGWMCDILEDVKNQGRRAGERPGARAVPALPGRAVMGFCGLRRDWGSGPACGHPGARLTRPIPPMRCPFCGTPDARVVDSRLGGEGDSGAPAPGVRGVQGTVHDLRDGGAQSAAGREVRRDPVQPFLEEKLALRAGPRPGEAAGQRRGCRGGGQPPQAPPDGPR